MPKYDITLLTASKYLSAEKDDWFVNQILDEDKLLALALEKRGLKVTRTNWDNPEFNWAETKYVIFRTPWDYFSRYNEFAPWLEKAAKVTKFINPLDIIYWNIDKHYLIDLEKAGINIPPAIFIEPGDKRPLSEIAASVNWNEFILKPAISGGAWHTYRLNKESVKEHEKIFNELVEDKSMLLQEFQDAITQKGEMSFIVLGGKFTHAVLKKVKGSDFRVQDQFGGTVHDYSPDADEIKFAEHVVECSRPDIAYARVDVMRDNRGELSLIELEAFEPSLWFAKHPRTAEIFADIIEHILRTS